MRGQKTSLWGEEGTVRRSVFLLFGELTNPVPAVYNACAAFPEGCGCSYLYRKEVMHMRTLSVQRLTLAGVLAALVFVMTAIPKVPVVVTGGYVHLGDGAIFLAGMLLGPLSIPAAAIGSGLSDLMGGYMVYVLPTMLIKALMALVVWRIWRADAWLRAVLAFVAAEAVMVTGYFALEAVLYGTAAALAAVMPNVFQGIAGVALGLVCHALYPRMKPFVRRLTA